MKPWMETGARIMLGSIFVVFGLDGVFSFIPLPPMPEPAAAFIEMLRDSGLFFAVKAIEVVAGTLLLLNRRTTLALLALAPIVFNIVWFDAALDPASLPVGLFIAGLEGTLLWQRRDRWLPLVGAAGPPAPAA